MAYLGFDEQEVGTIQRRKRKNLLQRAVSSPRTDRVNTAPPGLREPDRNASGLIEELRGGLPLPRSGLDRLPFSAPIYVNLFDDEGGTDTPRAFRP
ncbi:hypothetical protein N2603_36025 [Bradyrhizobium huanghuaihaiense]|uniref:hypothetical protein n=1 Tax=Bradyrhizobium huanghuaihaiense TaxID=990078 RepID=UPI0021AACE6A|nr:hypothetical protein [Bradyrhizobium sp. CB3035]UWU75403.1 hypothetical protein N2603_36025 [Bradyrhizobium sp. CB3035]